MISIVRNHLFCGFSNTFVLLIELLVATQLYCCPPSEEIQPFCSCKDLSEDTIMFCEGITCSDQFTLPIKTIAKYPSNIYSLSIFNSSLLYVPDDVFKGTHIEQIRFINSEIMSFSESDVAFQGLEETLSEFRTINSDFFAQWDWNQLRNLHRLTLIDIDSSALGAIETPFPYLPTLETLGITQAKISLIVDFAFSNLPKLSILSLKDNEISELKRSMLPNPATYLEIIDLSYNGTLHLPEDFFSNIPRLNYNDIHYLPEDFFSNMPRLERVALDENKLTTLHEKPFRHALETFKELTMSGNPFRCDCRLNWITETRFPLEFSAKCTSPTALKDTSLKNLQRKLLLC